MAKNGSFGFAKGRLVCRAKPNPALAGQVVPFVRLAKIVFKKSGSAKKIKHEALGCRVGKKSAVNFICRPNVSIIVCQFNGCCVVCYACLYRACALRWSGILALNLIRCTELPICDSAPAM